MDFKRSFCSSPWFHMRINNNGNFEYCRWMSQKDRAKDNNISNTSPITWFQQDMASIRRSMLESDTLSSCSTCYVMERNQKISGRQKQLLKVGVTVEDFEKSLKSSTWYPVFKFSQKHHGITEEFPQDWQIDLGNYCNSACVFCTHHSSSRLATELKSLGLITELPPRAWCDDPKSMQKLIDAIKQSSEIRYLHFIGGETLITPGFKKILQCLVDHGLNRRATIGFTTNLTVWDQSIVDLLCEFQEVNLGMSIECIHPLNDYLRYGSNLNETMEILDRWIDLGRSRQWLMQLRITPTVFSIWHLHTIYEYAMDNKIAVESCNFLDNPRFMRLSVLPQDLRIVAKNRLESFVIQHDDIADNSVVTNTRNPSLVNSQIIQDAKSYINYLETEPDDSYLLKDLVEYLRLLESNRKNKITDYLPEYEHILRHHGY